MSDLWARHTPAVDRVQTDAELERWARNPEVVAYANSGTCGQDHPYLAELRDYIAERTWRSECLALGEDE